MCCIPAGDGNGFTGGIITPQYPRKESFTDVWLFIIVNITILALLVNILSFALGASQNITTSITDVTAHVLYIPVVIAAYWYPKRGMLFAFIITAIYLLTIGVMTGFAPQSLVTGIIKCVVIVGVAAVVSSLALEMQKSEMKYRCIFDFSEAGTGLVNRKELLMVDMNQRLAAVLGYTPEELAKKRFEELWADPADPVKFFSNLDRDGSVEAFETRLLTKTKETRWVLLAAGKLPDEQFVINIVDITDRKRAEDAIAIKDHAIRSSINAVAMLDLNYTITYVNPSLLKVMNSFDDQDFLGRGAEVFMGSDGKTIDALRKGLAERNSWHGETVLYRPDKSSFYVLLSVSTVRDRSQKPVSYLVTFIDITDRKQMEKVKKQAFIQIDKNIEQFAILGDHLRNPLTVIVGLTSFVADDIAKRILVQTKEIDRIIDKIDQGWIESEKVRNIIKKYYDIGTEELGSEEPGPAATGKKPEDKSPQS